MKTHGWLIGLVIVALGAAPVPSEDAAKKDLAQMQGTWKVVQAVRHGEELAAEKREPLRLVVKDNQITMRGGDRDEEATFTLDAGKKPRQFDLIPKGDDAKKILGIYEINKDTMRMAWSMSGEERPSKFETTKESGVFLLVLERAKK
jgi:uncharacterized protein (TIGR03067 family)